MVYGLLSDDAITLLNPPDNDNGQAAWTGIILGLIGLNPTLMESRVNRTTIEVSLLVPICTIQSWVVPTALPRS